MICKVLMPDKSHKAIFVNSYTNVRDAFTDLATRIDLAQHTKYFSLFEVDDQQGTYTIFLLFIIVSLYRSPVFLFLFSSFSSLHLLLLSRDITAVIRRTIHL